MNDNIDYCNRLFVTFAIQIPSSCEHLLIINMKDQY